MWHGVERREEHKFSELPATGTYLGRRPSPRVLIISLISISGRSRAIFLKFIFLIGTIVSVALKFCSLALETEFLLSRTAVFLSFLFLLK